MSKLDTMNEELLEIYNIEREILWQEAANLGFKITAEQLRERARKVLRANPSFHNYEDSPNLEVEKYDE